MDSHNRKRKKSTRLKQRLWHILLFGFTVASVLKLPSGTHCLEDASHFALRPFHTATSPKNIRRQDENIPLVARQPLTTFVDDDEEDEDDLANDHLTAPVPHFGAGNIASIKPKQASFRRIRLPENVNAARPASSLSNSVQFPSKPQVTSPNEPALIPFQRVTNLPQPPATSPARQPATPSSRQTFRRVKPQSNISGSGARRVKPKIQPNQQTVTPKIQPSRAINNEPNSRFLTSNIVDLNRLHGRGPLNDRNRDDDLINKHNALDNPNDIETSAFNGNRFNQPLEIIDDNGVLAIESLSRISSSFPQSIRSTGYHPTSRSTSTVLTPTIPLTYYTTFTYLTTVLRGQHTALLSREQIVSTTRIQPIDRSIVTAIEFHNGYIQPSRSAVLPLGTKTKGVTTTIYNLVSRVNVFNDDLYKVIYASRNPSSSSIFATKSDISTTALESSAFIDATRTIKRPTPVSSTRIANHLYRLEDLEKEDKKLVSKYTYFFTIFDKLNTRYSTRVEESTANFVGNMNTVSPSLADSIDSDGLLQILSTKTSTLPLASRVQNKVTTVVNLALNNYIKFNSLKDAKIEIKPTKVNVHSPMPTSSYRPSVDLSGSLQPINSKADSNSVHTPVLSSAFVPMLSSKASIHSAISSSIVVGPRPSSRRPGIRVKVKPIRSQFSSRLSSSYAMPSVSLGIDSSLSSLFLSSIRHPSSSSPSSFSSPSPSLSLLSSLSAATSSFVDASSSNSAVLFSSSLSFASIESSRKETITPTAVLQSLSSSDVLSITPTLNRKKVAFTVRRPGFPGGGNRFFSRRPSSYLVRGTSVDFQRSSLLPVSSFNAYDVSSVVKETKIQPTSTIESSSFIETLSSSFIETLSSSSTKILPSSSIKTLPTSSIETLSSSVLPNQSKTSKRKLILTRISGIVNNNWNPIHSSRIRVSSRKVFKSTLIEPSSTIETILETTTHTVPFTLGDKTIYTTVEETNRRVLTKVANDKEVTDIASPTFVESSFEPTFFSSTVSSISSSTPTELMSHSPVIDTEKETTIVETTDRVTISTLYSTLTYFATLFNGTQTRITPLEEIKTEYLTLREPMTITRTIKPTMAASALPTILINSLEVVPSRIETDEHVETQTFSTHTTLTHFITLFSGTRTILSSIEEISPTVVTKTVAIPSSKVTMPTTSSETTSSLTESLSMASYVVDDLSAQAEITSSTLISSRLANLDSTISIIEPSPTISSILPLETIGRDTTLFNEEHTTSTTAVIKPGSVIELNDILHGEISNVGQIGETIKDIVHKVVNAQDDEITTERNDDETTTTSTTTTAAETTTATSSMTTMLQPSFEATLKPSTSTKETKITASLSSYVSKNRHYGGAPKYQHSHVYPSGISIENNKVIFSTESESDQSNVLSTRYVTSVEKSIRTLTITSTKVYYTRDSPLTITSVLTTTFPPVTYVSTIIGSKTILGTYNSITPTKSETPVMSTSVLPTMNSTILVSSSAVVTNRPRLQRIKTPSSETKRKTPFLQAPNTTRRPIMSTPTISKNMTNLNVDLQLCDVPCNSSNKEICKLNDKGQHACECRPNYVRRPSDNVCQEIKNYLVTVRVSKTSESEISVSVDNPDMTLQNYAKVARRQLMKGDSIAGLQVLSIDRSLRNSGTVVNMTVQLQGATIDVQDELSKKLQSLGQVEKVVDFDECSSPQHNDCSPRARCINKPGSYECQCLDSYIDLDQSLPGRLCVSEVKSCDFCYSRGDCWRHHSNTVCRCHPMYIGRRCEINGLLLAILVPILAISVIIAIVCFLYCSRKLRQRNRRFKNLAAYGPVAVIGGTLDRKAMLETSSESSDPQHRSPHYTSESNPASARGSMVRRDSRFRRESEPSLDRSLASYSVNGGGQGQGTPSNSLPPQILIPRARPSYALHRGGGPFYIW